MNYNLKTAMTIRTASGHVTGAYTILVPVAIYQLTGSLAMSGLFFLIENSVKFFIYLYGSSLLKLTSIPYAHAVAEIGRWLSIPLFAIIIYLDGPWWGVAIASIMNHMAQALTNLLYEPRINQWAEGDHHAYSYQLKADLFSGIVSTIIVLIAPLYIAFGALSIIQAYGSYLLYKNKNILYAHDLRLEQEREPVDLKTWMISEYSRPIKSIKEMSSELWGVVLLSMALMWPIAIIFCNIPFFLDAGFATSVSKSDVAWFTLIRTIMSFLILRNYMSLTKDKTSWLATNGTPYIIGLMSVLLLSMAITSSWVLAGVLLSYNALVYILLAKVRNLRQTAIPADHPNRSALTGMAVSLDSSLYMMASGALATGFSVPQAYILAYVGSAVFLIGSLWLLRKRWLPQVSTFTKFKFKGM